MYLVPDLSRIWEFNESTVSYLPMAPTGSPAQARKELFCTKDSRLELLFSCGYLSNVNPIWTSASRRETSRGSIGVLTVAADMRSTFG